MATTPVTLQQLIDAGTDAASLASIVNGTAAQSPVTTRLGTQVPTLQGLTSAVVAQSLLQFMGVYSATVTYPLGSLATVASGTYISIVAGNLNNPPATSPTKWGLFSPTGQGFTNRGAWTANTVYNAYDVFTNGTSAYLVTTGFTSGSTFSATNTSLILTAPGALSTTVPSSGSTSGAIGTSITVARSDHSHPINLQSITASQLMLPATANLFDVSRSTNPGAISNTGVLTSGNTGFCATGFMVVAGLASIIATCAFFQNTSFALCFYDANQVFISAQGTATIAAGTAITVPANACYARGLFATTTYTPAKVMVNAGTVQAAFQAFGYVTSDQLAASMATGLAGTSAFTENMLSNSLPLQPNLLDPAREVGGVLSSSGVLNTSGSYPTTFMTSGFMPVAGLTSVIANFGIFGTTVSGGFGPCFFDQNYVFVSCYGAANVPLGTAITVPANAVFMRVSWSTSSSQVPFYTNPAVLMVTSGTAVPSFRSFGYVTPDKLPTIPQVTNPNGYGGKLAVWGDSITAIFANIWQIVLTTRNGMTLSLQDAQSGRPTGRIFANYGDGTGTGTCISATGSGTVSSIGETVGQTIAQTYTQWGITLSIIEMGTNDMNTTIGTPGDSVTTATLCGQANAAITGLLNAAPTTRLVWVGPYYTINGTWAQCQAVDAALSAVCALYAIPYLSLFKLSGISPINNSVMTRDGIHCTDAIFKSMYGPAVSDFINQYI